MQTGDEETRAHLAEIRKNMAHYKHDKEMYQMLQEILDIGEKYLMGIPTKEVGDEVPGQRV